MKRNVIALICAAVVAVALLVPAGLQGLFAPKVPAGVTPAQTTSPQDRSGVPDGTASATSAAASDATVSESTGGNPPDQPEYVPGEILVGLADGVTVDQLNARLPELECIATDEVSEDDIHLGIVQLPLAQGVSVKDAATALAAEDFASFAEPNYILHAVDDSSGGAAILQAGSVDGAALSGQSSTINDPRSGEQWALGAIHAYEAWGSVRVEGSITVAVLDTGVKLNHEDLQDVLLCDDEGKVIGYNAEHPRDSPEDLQGHGTHVAGIISATTNNALGVSGVSYNAKIMPVRISSGATRDATIANITAGVEYVIKNAKEYNVKVINLSFGSDSEAEEVQSLTKVFKRAHDECGILVVVAAGNGGSSGPYHSVPCDYSPEALGVISVAQSGSSYVKGGTSNYNVGNEKSKPICAPGETILSTTKSATNSYGTMSGTSMATPCVAGVAALVFAANPSLEPADVRGILLDTAQDLNTPGWDNETGNGMVNAFAAVQKAATEEGGVGLSPTINGPSSVAVGHTVALTVLNTTDGAGWTWSSSDPNVATVVGEGMTSKVTGVKAGSVTITATSGDTVLTHDISVIETLDGASVQAIENQTYTSSAVKPSIVVEKGGVALREGVDYTVSYGNNTNVGTATVIVKGKGLYKGSLSSSFKIVPASLEGATVRVSDVGYTGAALKPLPTVEVGGKTLKKDVDYTVGYANNTNVGAATLTITGKGNYKGSVSKNFTIQKAKLTSAKTQSAKYTYTGSQISPTIIAYGPKSGLSNQVLREGVDYAVVSIPSGRTNAGTYSYYIVSGMGNYEGNAYATLTITAASLSSATVSMPVTSVSYTGSALKPAVTVKLGGKTLANGIDYTVSYSNNVNVGTGLVTITGKGNYSGTRTTTFKIIPSAADASKGHGVQYRTHVQNIGWQGWKSNGATSGTSGQSLRLEGINISLANHPYSGSIRYRTHVQNIGWESQWKYDGAMSGTSGQSLRLEAIRIELTGQMAAHYDVYYRVHAQNIGWMGWAKNGESAGTAGYSYRLEAIQIVLRPKGSSAPTPSPRNAYNAAFKTDQIRYRTHVQNVGWQGFVGDGAVSGTSGRSLRLEGININIGSESGISGGVEYRTHIQNNGWEKQWKHDGAMSGTSGQSLRLEAIQIRLTGNAAKQYDIYYRVHCQNIGWMGWAKNGAPAGTAGYAYRLEAIQIKLVPKGGLAPGSTAYAYRQR